MKEMVEYAEQWDVSAKYHYDKGYYAWMAQRISGYNTVLELGCGTGYSTLALCKEGFKVLAVDKNSNCIQKMKQLLDNNGIIDEQVVLLEGDVVGDDFRTILLSEYKYDIVLCWNVGSDWSKRMIQYYYPYMLEYGLDLQQIQTNPESAYVELINWETGRLAKAQNVPMHFIDRGVENMEAKKDPYYWTIKDEFGYSEIIYENLVGDSVSNGGRVLSTNGKVHTSKTVAVVFNSMLIK